MWRGLSTDDLIKTHKIIFSEYGLPSKIASDVSTNFISEKFQRVFMRPRI